MTWTASDAALPSGAAAGVFALDFANPRQGIAVGGDFADPAAGTSSVGDGSQWSGAGGMTHLGEDVAWLTRGRATAIAVGEGGGVGGTSVTHDGGLLVGTSVWVGAEETGQLRGVVGAR